MPEMVVNDDYAAAAVRIREVGDSMFPGIGFEKIVFTNGCFDVIHPGHMMTLSHCRALAGPCGAVVVGMNDDASVTRLKGQGRPILDVEARGTVLSAVRFVDFVVTFEEDTPLKLIETLRPDVIVKGGDYDPADVVGSQVCPVEISPYDGRWSTTEILKRLRIG